jgi:hypothetical protein
MPCHVPPPVYRRLDPATVSGAALAAAGQRALYHAPVPSWAGALAGAGTGSGSRTGSVSSM